MLKVLFKIENLNIKFLLFSKYKWKKFEGMKNIDMLIPDIKKVNLSNKSNNLSIIAIYLNKNANKLINLMKRGNK